MSTFPDYFKNGTPSYGKILQAMKHLDKNKPTLRTHDTYDRNTLRMKVL